MLRLTFERKRRGWSQSDAAERAASLLGPDTRLRLQTTISRIELGLTTPSEAELEALATIFDVSPAFKLLCHVDVVASEIEEPVR
jgi:transcriptional regulator with XRE-family HTH domain